AEDERGEYPLDVIVERAPGNGLQAILDARGTVLALAADAERGTSASIVAARFHAALASATSRACAEVASRRGLDSVVLGGGVFQNRVLVEACGARLAAAGLRVLVAEKLPPNDGGISLGQAAIAAARLSAG